jgi:hypothetical protein
VPDVEREAQRRAQHDDDQVGPRRSSPLHGVEHERPHVGDAEHERDGDRERRDRAGHGGAIPRAREGLDVVLRSLSGCGQGNELEGKPAHGQRVASWEVEWIEHL